MTRAFRIGFLTTFLAVAGCGEAVVGSSTLANTPPTIEPIADVTIPEDSPAMSFTVNLTDTESTDVLVVTASSSDPSIIAPGGIVVSGTGSARSLSITPLPDANGQVTITISVADADDYVVTSTFVITVSPINDAPTIVGLTNQTIDEDTTTGALAFTVNDVDDPLTALVVTATTSDTTLLPLSGIAIGGTGGARTLTLTPTTNAFGMSTVVVTVTDVAGLNAAQTLVLTVNSVNDRPVANADAATLAEGASANVDLATNDTDVDGTVDVATIVIVTSPAHGTVTVNANGTVDYTHDSTENFTDSFTYTIADDQGLASLPGTVMLTITPVNDAPVAVADNATVNEAATVNLPLAANDTDAEGALDVTSIVIVGNPLHGGIVVNANGTVDYTHDGSETISDTFTYTIEDVPGLLSNVATVTITINPVNDAPVAVADTLNVDEGSAVTGSLSANDTDSEGQIDVASIVIVTGPIHGSIVVNGDGTVTYTHDGSETVSDSFTYTIRDIGVPPPSITSNVVTVSIVVAPVNDAPVAVNDSFTVPEAATRSLALSANDTDVDIGDSIDPASIVIVGNPLHGAIVVNANGSVTYTHDGSETVSDSFTYTIRDVGAPPPSLPSNSATVSITITPVNDAPIAGDDTGVVLEAGTVHILASANDTDAEGLLDVASIIIGTGPVNGSVVVNADGSLDYTHDGTETVSDTFTYTIRDTANTVSNVATVTITIQPTNDPPVASDDSFTVNEGSTTALTVAANDTDAENQLNLASIVIVSGAAHGTLTPNAGGTVTYVHDGSETLSDSFTYTIRDSGAGTLLSNVATVTISVAPVNDPPVANADSATVNEAGSVLIDLAVNDTDVDNALNLASIVVGAAALHGSVTVNANGTVTYTHDGSETLSDSFTYRIRDAAAAFSNFATVSITVTPVNDAPIAVNDSVGVNEGAVATFAVLANDTDADNAIDVASVVVVGTPIHGSFVVNASGSVTYTHDGTDTTTDSFTYNVKDVSGATSNTATVNIAITAVNDPPIAVVDSGTVNEGAAGTFNLAANDSDPDGALNLASIVITTAPLHGVIVVNAGGTVTYTHDGSETTSDSFQYTIRDNGVPAPSLPSNAATVSVTVTPVNDAPTAVADAGTVLEGGAGVIGLAGNDTDPDSLIDPTSIVITTAPLHGLIIVNPDGTVNYAHDGSETTSDTFAYTIKDTLGATSAPGTVTVTVTPTNDPPVANNDTGTVNEGASATFNLAVNDTDPDGFGDIDLASIVVTVAPTHGSIVVNAGGTVTYTHDGSETTSDSFSYTIKDASAVASNAATVAVTVNPVNDAPVVAAVVIPPMSEDTPSGAITITFTDADDACGTATFTLAVSSNDNVLFPPATAFAFVASGTTCTRSLTLTPGPNAAGSATITVTVTDPGGATSTPATTATATVAPLFDDPPVGVNDGPFGTTGNVTIATGMNVLTNDTDPDVGDTLRVTGSASCATAAPTSVATVQNGRVTIAAGGAVVYTPPPGYTGSDSFVYRVCDAADHTAIATISFTIGLPMVWYVDNNHPSPGTTAAGTGGTDVHPFATLAGLDAEPMTGNGDTVYIDVAGGTTAGYDTGFTAKAGMSIFGMPLSGAPAQLTGAGAIPAITFVNGGSLQHVDVVGGTNGVAAASLTTSLALADVAFTGVATGLNCVGSGGASVSLDGVRVSGATAKGVSLTGVSLSTSATNRTNRIAATAGSALVLDTVALAATFEFVDLIGATGAGITITNGSGSLTLGSIDVQLTGVGSGLSMTGSASVNLGAGGNVVVRNGFGIHVNGGGISGGLAQFDCTSTTDDCLAIANATSGLALGDFTAMTTGHSAIVATALTGSFTIADATAGVADSTGAPTISMSNVANASLQLRTIDGLNTGANVALTNLTGTSTFTVNGDGSGAKNGSGGDLSSTGGSAIDLNAAGTVLLKSMNVISTGNQAVEVQGTEAITLTGLDINGADTASHGAIFVHGSGGSVTMNACAVHDATDLLVVSDSGAPTTLTWTQGSFANATADCVRIVNTAAHVFTGSFTGTSNGSNEFAGCASAALRMTDSSSGAVSLTSTAMDFGTSGSFINATLSGGGAETLTVATNKFASGVNDAIAWTSTGCNARNQVHVSNSTFGTLLAFGTTSTAGNGIAVSVTGAACTVEHLFDTNRVFGVQTLNKSGIGLSYDLSGVSPSAVRVLNNQVVLSTVASPSDANALRFVSAGATGMCFNVRNNTFDSNPGGFDVTGGSGNGGAQKSTLEGWPAATPSLLAALTATANVEANGTVNNSSSGGVTGGFQSGTCTVP